MAKVIIVNDNDEIIRYKERATVEATDIYRVSALWVQDSMGNILLAQRSLKKKNSPGKWGPAVAGTNEEGETYESNILKEAEEEIGLKGYAFQKKHKERHLGDHDYFVQIFFLMIDKNIGEFKVQESEVQQVKWFTKKGLLEELKQNPDMFLKSVKDCFDLFNK